MSKYPDCGDCNADEIWLAECHEADYMTASGNHHTRPDNPCDKCTVKLQARIAELEAEVERKRHELKNYANNLRDAGAYNARAVGRVRELEEILKKRSLSPRVVALLRKLVKSYVKLEEGYTDEQHTILTLAGEITKLLTETQQPVGRRK